MSSARSNNNALVAPRLTYFDHDLAVGAHRRLLFCVWRDRTTVEGVQRAHLSISECLRGNKDPWAFVTIIEPGAKMPEPGTRELIAQLLKGLSGRVVISGVAFEGSGFAAASVRAIVTGLTALARQPFPHRVFESIGELALWFESKQQETKLVLPAAQTLGDVGEFRRCLGLAASRNGP